MNKLRQTVSATLALMLLFAVCGCFAGEPMDKPSHKPSASQADQSKTAPVDSDSPVDREAVQRRQAMVDQQLRGRDIDDPAVLRAMDKVPRHRFVPARLQDHAYDDRPLPIGQGQTISQPYIVALMTQLAEPTKNSKALDVGTGSGYQAAVLAELVKTVYSIEIVKPLAVEAEARLKSLDYQNVHVRHGDGYQGWQEHAPFDLIIVAAAPDHVPDPLIDQLAVGGKLVIPVGSRFSQKLLVLSKHSDGSIKRSVVAPVAFVPMTGQSIDKK
jgi:protein-L-isoaspartate(D-aspartate) O-methyltransferase